VDDTTMVGFGFKQAWLAVRDAAPEAVVGALGAQPVGTMSWRLGLDSAYTYEDLVAVTPPLAGAGGAMWVLACGRWLLAREDGFDVASLSDRLDREVQFFATYRVSELHHWHRAIGGVTIRSFRYVGETGEVTQWRGEPDQSELSVGLPSRIGPETDVVVDESDVMRLAAQWSIDPTSLEGRPAPGPLTLARL